MYDYIKGKLVSKLPMAAKGAAIVVENNGIGYFVHTTGRTVSLAGAENSDVKIYTSLIHREDSMMFCGFLNKEDRDIFNILLSVSGVGMKVALITTVGGLVVAIILQFFYNYIVAKIDSIVLSMEDASISLVDMVVKYAKK